jgi:hypothetical protein
MKSPVHISQMSGKLEGFHSISTNTVTNPFCQKMNKSKDSVICSHCYSMSMLTTYRKTTATALQRNSDLLSCAVLMIPELPTISDPYFRFNSHGELLNETNLRNYIKIAEHNPNTNFALWTKRKDIVNSYAKKWGWPDNFILVYSNPTIDKVMDTPPRFFDRVFNNVTDAYKGEANCTGQKCKDCLLCYKHDTTKVIVEHVK